VAKLEADEADETAGVVVVTTCTAVLVVCTLAIVVV
jgi:hypothetical protein